MRCRGLLLVVLLVGASLYGVSVVGTPASAQPHPPADQLVAPDGTDSYVWPYTSRRQSPSGRTLALNVVVHGHPENVRRAFVDRSGQNWTAVHENQTVDVSPWRPAHGSTRYTYVADSQDGSGHWAPPDYQLAVGAYFGERTHIRAYPSASGNWTALQAHTEYWDWFRLRHTVTGVGPGAAFVERDLHDEPFVHAVDRSYHGYTGGGSNGSWTVVEFAPSVAVAGVLLPLTARRLPIRDLAIAGALLVLVLGLRAGGLAAEAVAPGANPKLFVALGYPVLAVGPPVVVSVLARERPALPASLLAFGGLTAATVLDLALVGITQIPPRIVHHRVALAAALGVVAFGAARGDRRVVGVGLVAWTLALAAPLFGFV